MADVYEQLEHTENLAVPLARYARQVGYHECAFWGVYTDDQRSHACSDIWLEAERSAVARALAEAQQLFEREVGFPLAPRHIVGARSEEPLDNPDWVDEQPYRSTHLTRYARVLDFGARVEEVLTQSAAVALVSDPAVITLTVPTGTQTGELALFYPGSARPIAPAQVAVAEDTAVFTVPRCRLVASDRIDNPPEGLAYTDPANFQQAVEVRRITTDPARQAVLVGSTQDGEPSLVSAEVTVVDAWVGRVRVAAPRCSPRSCRTVETVRFYYRAGLTRVPEVIETALIRLAHTRLPTPPCACSRLKGIWEEDRREPRYLSAAQLECPFGTAAGAYQAWNIAKSWRARRLKGM